MKRIGITILGLVVSVLAHAQDKETRSLSSFDEVSVGEAIELIMKDERRSQGRGSGGSGWR